MYEHILSDPWADHPVVNRHICNFGGGGGGEKEVKTQETQLPGWVDTASQNNYGYAKTVVDEMQGPYQGQRVADLTPGQQQNINALQNNVGATNANYGAAQNATSNFLNYNAPTVSAGQLSNTNLAPYMNPFTQQVIQGGLQSLEAQRMQALNQTGAQAAQARAFGGSRQGVQEGITNAASAMQAGQLYSGLQSQNFMQAQNAATGDIGRRYAADVANQNANMQGAGISLNAANQLGGLTSQGQNAYLQSLQAAMGGQGMQQQYNQQMLDAARGLYGEQQQLPLQKLQVLQGALSNSPYGNTVVSTQPGPSSNPGMQAAGMAMQGASLLPMMMMASDRRMKTDIQKMGKDEETGLNLFAYRYKGDPKTYAKTVGPMAQDIRKKYPDQVKEIGGRLAVKSNFLSGIMERAA